MGSLISRLGGITTAQCSQSTLHEYLACTVSRLYDSLALFRAAAPPSRLSLDTFDTVFGPSLGDCASHFHTLRRADDDTVDVVQAFGVIACLCASALEDAAALLYDAVMTCTVVPAAEAAAARTTDADVSNSAATERPRTAPVVHGLPIDVAIAAFASTVHGMRQLCGVPELPKKAVQGFHLELRTLADGLGCLSRPTFTEWCAAEPDIRTFRVTLRQVVQGIADGRAMADNMVQGGNLFAQQAGDGSGSTAANAAVSAVEHAFDAPIKALQKDARQWLPLEQLHRKETLLTAVQTMRRAPVDVCRVVAGSFTAARSRTAGTSCCGVFDVTALFMSFIQPVAGVVCTCRGRSRRRRRSSNRSQRKPSKPEVTCCLHDDPEGASPSTMRGGALPSILDRYGRAWAIRKVHEIMQGLQAGHADSRGPPPSRPPTAADTNAVPRRASHAYGSRPSSPAGTDSATRGGGAGGCGGAGGGASGGVGVEAGAGAGAAGSATIRAPAEDTAAEDTAAEDTAADGGDDDVTPTAAATADSPPPAPAPAPAPTPARRATVAATTEAIFGESRRLSATVRRGSTLIAAPEAARTDTPLLLPVFFDQPMFSAASLLADGVANLGVVTSLRLNLDQVVSVVPPITLVRYVSERLAAALGRAMHMTVADARLGANSPPHCLPASMLTVTAWHRVAALEPPIAVAVDHGGVPVTVVSPDNAVRHVLASVIPANASKLLQPLSAWERRPVMTCSLDDTVATVLCRCAGGEHPLFVSNDATGELVGVITPAALVRFVGEMWDEVLATEGVA